MAVTVLFSWTRDFSTDAAVVLADVTVAAAVFAAWVAGVRLFALRELRRARLEARVSA